MVEKGSVTPPKETEKTAQDAKKAAEPTNPYEEGSKRFLVAKALISGEVDRKKIARETGATINTVYNVTSDLLTHRYVLAIHEKKRREVFSPPPPPSSPSPTPTNLPHGKGSKEGSAVRSSVRLTGDSGAGKGEGEVAREVEKLTGDEKNLTEDELLTLAKDIEAKTGMSMSEIQSAVSEISSRKTSRESGKISPGNGSNQVVHPEALKLKFNPTHTSNILS